MSDTPPPRPPRRPRYAGKNPRRFEDKYKELNAAQYADDVAKVIASGKTPAGSHRPIMVQEILEVLSPQPGDTAVDCTLGYGGHARELLARVAPPAAAGPRGRLLGLDVDPIEQPKTIARLRAFGWDEPVFTGIRSNFAGLSKVLAAQGITGADVILADLGVSSMQLDDPARGFTFKTDAPLDLRLNPQRAPSAAEWLARVSRADLATVLRENADEPAADTIAETLTQLRHATPFTRTRQLADAIRRALPKPPAGAEADDTPVRRVFQALRIAVNDEFGVLDTFLRQLPFCLKPGGRVAILTFHSGEDRRVKIAFRDGVRAGVYAATNDEIIRASGEEQRSNPRSTSAKLRWAIRA